MSFRPLARAVTLAALAASAPAGEIRGRVLVDGKPAPGVAVAILPFEDGFEEARREARREGLPQPLAAATTRSDGTFAAVVAAAAGTSVRLGFSGSQAAPRVLEALFDAAGGDAGDVHLAKAAALAGRVVEERGGPVVGASVTLWPGGERRPQDVSPGRGVPLTTTSRETAASASRAPGRIEPTARRGPGFRHARAAAGARGSARAPAGLGTRAGAARQRDAR
jgi:hypothetical protein